MELVVWVLADTVLTLSLCSCSSKKYSELETWLQGGGGNTKNLSEHECVLGGGGRLGNRSCGWKGEAEAHGKLEVFTKFCVCFTQQRRWGGGEQINDSVNLGRIWQ